MVRPDPVRTAGVLGELRVQARLAVPVVVGLLGTMGMGVVDTVMVGAFGGEALAAVSLAVMWGFALVVVPRGVAKGLDPIVSQAYGAAQGGPGAARRRARASAALVQGLLMVGLIGLPVALLHLVAAQGLALLGQPAHLLDTADAYSRVMALGVFPMLAFVVVKQFLQGLGNVRPATVAVLAANGLNVVLNRVLMHGVGTWQGLGPIGCAWSSVVGALFMLGLLCWLTRRELAAWWPADPGAAARDLAGLRSLAALGAPLGLQQALEVWGFHAAGVMVGWLGETPLAAHTVALNLATVAFMTPLGISAAAATRVGNLLGAGRPWGRAALVAMGAGASVMFLSAACFGLLPDTLARIYTRDAAVVALAASILPLAAAFQLFDGVQVVGFGVLRGLGDVRLPTLVNVVAYWCLGLPAGGLLAFRLGWGVRGVWAGLALALSIVAVLLTVRILWLHRRGVAALED